MARGGKRAGAGRKLGSATKRTREIADKAAEEGVTPLEYMLTVMRSDTEAPERRLDAAKSAAPYVHPKLASMEIEAGKELKKLVISWMMASSQ